MSRTIIGRVGGPCVHVSKLGKVCGVSGSLYRQLIVGGFVDIHLCHRHDGTKFPESYGTCDTIIKRKGVIEPCGKRGIVCPDMKVYCRSHKPDQYKTRCLDKTKIRPKSVPIMSETITPKVDCFKLFANKIRPYELVCSMFRRVFLMERPQCPMIFPC